jgi:hypothetical protein
VYLDLRRLVAVDARSGSAAVTPTPREQELETLRDVAMVLGEILIEADQYLDRGKSIRSASLEGSYPDTVVLVVVYSRYLHREVPLRLPIWRRREPDGEPLLSFWIRENDIHLRIQELP